MTSSESGSRGRVVTLRREQPEPSALSPLRPGEHEEEDGVVPRPGQSTTSNIFIDYYSW